jgi:hypothetical protein
MEDQFSDWLESLRTEIKKEVAAVEKAVTDFAAKRDTVIFPKLEHAAVALKESGTQATAKNANGDSAILEIGEHSLSFSLDGSVIVCSSSLLHDEEFALMPLAEAMVDRKVRQFVARALRLAALGDPEPPTRVGSVIMPRRKKPPA